MNADPVSSSTPGCPTVIVVHPRENRAKCSVEPLRGQPEFEFWKFPNRGSQSIDGYVRLGIGGPLLTASDRDNGLLLLDGTWRLAEKMENDFSTLPVRSLLDWQTAYPRVSKVYADPSAGLATIEALFAAHAQLGIITDTLLDHYRWKEEFLDRNAELIRQCGTAGLEHPPA
ncbi:MAG TPA: hypothetical protein VNQ76_18160 [Planctomicrobium sp.]|nr:hypothetical protein [Planctomicrobium sp.]